MTPLLRRCEKIAFWQGVVGATLVVAPGRPHGPSLQRDSFTPPQREEGQGVVGGSAASRSTTPHPSLTRRGIIWAFS
jgi:hypothetical protein